MGPSICDDLAIGKQQYPIRVADRKVEIMNHYASELHADPLPRGDSAIRGLARYRGATIAVDAAEAFMLVREIA